MTTQPSTCECPYCHQAIKVDGRVVFDKYAHTIERDGVKAKLTRQQQDVFALLYAKLERPVRHEHIYDGLFGLRPDCDQPDTNIIKVRICELRKLIRPLGFGIKLLWGEGYRLHTLAETQESKAA